MKAGYICLDRIVENLEHLPEKFLHQQRRAFEYSEQKRGMSKHRLSPIETNPVLHTWIWPNGVWRSMNMHAFKIIVVYSTIANNSRLAPSDLQSQEKRGGH